MVAPWVLSLLAASFAQTPSQLKTEEEVMRESMVSMSRQLGITCAACHDTENFRSDKKMEFRVAKEHMKITQSLIDLGMDGKKGPKATCYMCHRGELKPAYKELLPPLKK